MKAEHKKNMLLFRIGAAVLLLSLLCASCGQGTVKTAGISTQKIAVSDIADSAEKPPQTHDDAVSLEEYRVLHEMSEFSIGSKSFYIDNFPVSEIQKDFYFSCELCGPVSGLSFQEAQSVCVSMGKRICSLIEWKKNCISVHKNYSEARKDICESAETADEIILCITAFVPQKEKIHSRISFEWVLDDHGPAVASSSADTNDACSNLRFVSSNHRNSEIGFRCCRDR